MHDWIASRFSLAGLAVVVLQQIPGIVWAICPPKVDPFARNSGSLIVEVLEKAFGVGTLLLLVLGATGAPPEQGRSAWLVAAFLVLSAYYVLYVLYYLGIIALPVLLGMAAFPPIAFLLTGIHQGNYLAVATAAVFGVVHVGLTLSNFAPRR